MIEPWRSDSGLPRPLHEPLTRPSRGGRPLKRWLYAGVFGPGLMLCAGQVRIGPLRQSFWALYDGERLRERTRNLRGRGRLDLGVDHLNLRDDDVEFALQLHPGSPIETISPHGGRPIWTRKRGGVAVGGEVRVGGRALDLAGCAAVIDESAGYHERETAWRWCAGIGRDAGGRALAWNLAEGIHDAPQASENTLWVEGEPRPLEPQPIAADLSRAGGLEFTALATRARHERLAGGLLSSDYEQPFGTFAGTLGPIELAQGWGVMERHRARW